MLSIESVGVRRKEIELGFPEFFILRHGQLEPLTTLNIGLPWRVKNRALLHQIGATQMFTAVAYPEECCLDEDELIYLAKQAERTNQRIGLPKKVNSLVVRTRDAIATARVAGTNPMLVISGINSGRIRYTQLQTEYTPEREFSSFESWRMTRPPYIRHIVKYN